jgi:phosphoadenosine phosphosulfate reductase
MSVILDLQQEAIDFLQTYEPDEGYFVGFSGGKDSIVTYDLVKKSGVKYQIFYSMTLIDPPEVTRFIREIYPEVIRLKPKMTFWQGIMKKGLPLMHRRWCCDVLKKDPSKSIPLNHHVTGVRAEESPNRMKRGRIFKLHNKFYNYHPIFYWSSSEIWEYIKYYELSYPHLYDEGFGRIGCCVCPFIRNKIKLKQHKEKWPNFYRILDIYLNKIWEERGEDFIAQNFTYDEFMSWPNWKTKEQRKQMIFKEMK